jgi:hypothetical protein
MDVFAFNFACIVSRVGVRVNSVKINDGRGKRGVAGCTATATVASSSISRQRWQWRMVVEVKEAWL